MDIIEEFSVSTDLKDKTILKDIEDFIKWETEHGEGQFNPEASDDVAIRTYLLDCHIRGINHSVLNRISSSLEQFYAWLKAGGYIVDNPFKEYNLKQPFLEKEYLTSKHDAFPGAPEEREISRLRALNDLGVSNNRALDVQSMLDGTLETILGVMTLNTAWISLKVGNGLLDRPTDPIPVHGFFLAAASNLPPSLEKSNRYYLTRPPECHCQQLLRTGKLKRGVNIVECSRLRDSRESQEDDRGLMFHASVPIAVNDQLIGIMNVATKDWQLLSASDLQFLNSASRQMGFALERAHLHDLVREDQIRLEQELDLARKMQISLLPCELPAIAGYSLAAFWQPAYETSGDYYNVFKLPGGQLGFIIADVAGKGAPAALRMAMAHILISEKVENETSPAALLMQINQALCKQDLDMQFVTSIYAILDPESATLKYSIAGHPPPFLRLASGRVKQVAGKGIALGINPEAHYEDINLTLAPGDSLVAFTDGVTDANSPSYETYEMTQLEKAIGSAPAEANALLDHLQCELVEWVKEAPKYDDITLLAISREP